MSETAKFANVVLPGASFFEKSGTFTNGERRVQRVNEVIPPLAGTKTDGQIVVDIMNRMGIPQPDYTPDGVLAEIARVVPFFKGATWEGLGDNGKQWPIKEGCVGTEILHTDTSSAAAFSGAHCGTGVRGRPCDDAGGAPVV